MGFLSVRSYHYRNLADSEIDLDAPRIFFVGENGQGKTNILEAVYYLCFGSSFRAHADALLVRHGERTMALEGRYLPETDGSQEQPSTISVKLDEAAKEVQVNGKQIRDRKELIANIPCILFSHEDISFITGAPEERRWFLNQTMSLYNPEFIELLRRYYKVLRMRNAVLKEGRSEMLDLYDGQLAEAGIAIQAERAKTVTLFNETFVALFRKISGLDSDLVISYLPSWTAAGSSEEALRLLRERLPVDLSRLVTTTGPHRDHITFSIGGRSFAKIASTGQLRLASLILRVAQAAFFAERSGRKPLLLLDDVLLELDLKRRGRFLESLPEVEQAFFTFLPDEQYRGYQTESTRVYRVSNGVVSGGIIP